MFLQDGKAWDGTNHFVGLYPDSCFGARRVYIHSFRVETHIRFGVMCIFLWTIEAMSRPAAGKCLMLYAREYLHIMRNLYISFHGLPY